MKVEWYYDGHIKFYGLTNIKTSKDRVFGYIFKISGKTKYRKYQFYKYSSGLHIDIKEQDLKCDFFGNGGYVGGNEHADDLNYIISDPKFKQKTIEYIFEDL